MSGPVLLVLTLFAAHAPTEVAEVAAQGAEANDEANHEAPAPAPEEEPAPVPEAAPEAAPKAEAAPEAEAGPEAEAAPDTEPEGPPAPAPYSPELQASEGLPPWLVLPLQAAAGALCGIPLMVAFPVAPLLIAFVVAVVGDFLGQQRGALLWPILAGFGGMVVGGLLPPAGWALTAVLGAALGALAIFFAGGSAASTPFFILAAVGLILAYIAGVTTFLAPVSAAVGGGVGSSCGASLGYYFTAESKREGDVEFRWPGLFEPAHSPETYTISSSSPGMVY